jgi:hypothetical protein
MLIRSYRRVFDIERRIYRIDRIRLNPGGVPVRGVIYFLALLVAVLVLERLPLVSAMAGPFPWYARVVALPAAGATVLSVIMIEGRPFHLSARALWRHRLRPRRLSGVVPAPAPGRRWYPPDVLLIPDGSDSHFRRFRFSGPGAVLVTVEHERTGRAAERGSAGVGRPGRRPALTIRATADAAALQSGQVIALAAGVRLLVRSQGRRGR